MSAGLTTSAEATAATAERATWERLGITLCNLFVSSQPQLVSLKFNGQHVCGGPYQPGTAGIQWTEAEAKIIRSKIVSLWKNWKKTVQDFDFGTPEATNTDYVYDPNKRTYTKDCKSGLCDTYWRDEKRLSGIAFTERKAIRLSFHDCIPYTDDTGGCDGGLNFNENLEGNMALQHSVAILVK